MRMLNRVWAVSALALVLVLGAPLAGAQQRWIVSGTLDEADPDARLVEVAEHTYQLTPSTRIKGAGDAAASWADIVAREGRYVSMLVRPGRPYDRVFTIVLEDEDSDD